METLPQSEGPEFFVILVFIVGGLSISLSPIIESNHVHVSHWVFNLQLGDNSGNTGIPISPLELSPSF